MGEDWEQTGLEQIRGLKGCGCNVLIQRVSFIVSLNTEAFSHWKSASTRTSCDSRHAL